jgi:hypothetical protein
MTNPIDLAFIVTGVLTGYVVLTVLVAVILHVMFYSKD